MSESICPDCQVAMEGGFLIDHTYGERMQSSWVEGAPEFYLFGLMKLRGRRRIPVFAWRCPQCTRVRLYAPEEG